MFDYLREFVGRTVPPNRFWPLSDEDIDKAEQRLHFRFPPQLRTFFQEIGCGFLAQGIDDNKRDRSLVNRVLSPGEIADILTISDLPTRPAEGFPKGVIPFFDIGENSYFVLSLSDSDPHAVYWPGARKPVAVSVQKFFQQLYCHAGFYRALGERL